MIGINLSGAEFGSGIGTHTYDYIYPSASSLTYYANQGVDFIRLPFKWERIQQTLDGDLNQNELTLIKTVLQDAQAAGLKVILDVHNYAEYNGARLGTDGLPISSFTNLWGKLASALKEFPALEGYGLMNEPVFLPTTTTWPEAAQAAIDKIRAVDTKTAIYVGGADWGGAATWKDLNAGLAALKDPSKNLVFEAHQYFDQDMSGTYRGTYDSEGAYANIGVDRLQPFLSWLKENNLKGFIGEYGIPNNDPRWQTVMDNFLAELAKNNVSSAYWGAGPWWGDYPLSIEPVNGSDSAQMAVLKKYMDATAPVIDPPATSLPPVPAVPVNEVHGKSSGDKLTGKDGYSNHLYGEDGGDKLYGKALNDHLFGGNGNDGLWGEDGNDVLSGDSGNDSLYGGNGNDTLDGGTGSDRLEGGSGDDTMNGQDGSDTLYGQDGNDTLSGGSDADKLYGDAGNDFLDGGDGNDRLEGGTGDDYLEGQAGDDLLYGQDGDDFLAGGDGNDQLKGGNGQDRLDGGSGTDKLYGESQDDLLNGGNGNDTLYGQDGNDTLYGDSDSDTLYGGNGLDHIYGGTEADKLYGEAGDDILDGGDGDDRLDGGSDNDLLYGGEGKDLLYGQDGNDVLYGDAGDDQLWGGNGIDSLDGGAGVDVLDGGSGNDILLGGDDNDTLKGQSGDDLLNGGSGNDQLYGGSGADIFVFDENSGIDKLLDFNFKQGDRLDIGDQSYLASSISGGVQLTLSGGGTVTITSLKLADLNDSYFV